MMMMMMEAFPHDDFNFISFSFTCESGVLSGSYLYFALSSLNSFSFISPNKVFNLVFTRYAHSLIYNTDKYDSNMSICSATLLPSEFPVIRAKIEA